MTNNTPFNNTQGLLQEYFDLYHVVRQSDADVLSLENSVEEKKQSLSKGHTIDANDFDNLEGTKKILAAKTQFYCDSNERLQTLGKRIISILETLGNKPLSTEISFEDLEGKKKETLFFSLLNGKIIISSILD
jgi:hypothetical protein